MEKKHNNNKKNKLLLICNLETREKASKFYLILFTCNDDTA